MRAQSLLTWDRIDLRRHERGAERPDEGQQDIRLPAFTGGAVRLLREALRLSPDGGRVFQYDGKPVANFNTNQSRIDKQLSGGC
jgi:hypothetical protein